MLILKPEQQSSKKGSSAAPILKITFETQNTSVDYSFEFPNDNTEIGWKNRDNVIKVLQKYLSQNQKNAAIDSKRDAEINIRAELLKNSLELRNLHSQLVVSKVITDDEFWESRRVHKYLNLQ